MSHVYVHGHKIVNHIVTFYVTTYWNGPSNIIYLYLVSLFDPSGAENELSLYLTLKVEWKLDCCIISYKLIICGLLVIGTVIYNIKLQINQVMLYKGIF